MSIYQEDIGNLNVYVPDNRAVKYVKQKLIELEREIDKCTIIVGNLTPLSLKLIEQEDSKSAVI